jgi:hypothetical protein
MRLPILSPCKPKDNQLPDPYLMLKVEIVARMLELLLTISKFTVKQSNSSRLLSCFTTVQLPRICWYEDLMLSSTSCCGIYTYHLLFVTRHTAIIYHDSINGFRCVMNTVTINVSILHNL